MKCKFRDTSLTLRERINDLLNQLTIDEKINMLSSHHAPVERLGIKEWHVGCEVARGFVSRDEKEISTVFPQPIGMASTFDKALMRKIGEIAADDARYYYNQNPNGKLMVWGPTVDMERNPLWGRNEEAYGEDTCLAGEMTREYTIGMAGASRADEPEGKSILDCRTDEDGVLLKTVPTLKHFCANNHEEDRITDNSNATERLLHEYYYRAFKYALCEGGAHSVMAAYNKIDGIPGDMNPDIQRILKDKWGMDFAVTDGGAFSQNVLNHKFVSTHSQALAMCIKNGMDTMTDNRDMVTAAAKDGLEKGIITEDDIDKAVGNVLLGRFRLGEFDNEHKYSAPSAIPDSMYARSINKTAALEQVCMLKNNGILPIKSADKILIAGPIAGENYKDWYTGVSSYNISIRAAFENALGDKAVFDNGWDIIALKCKHNGKYLCVSDDGKITASADTPTDKALFELHNWDDNTYNLKSLHNGKYVTEEGCYQASSDIPYAWFVREWLKPKKYGDYLCFDNWHNDSVYVSEDNCLRTQSKRPPADNSLFSIEIISKGSERLCSIAKDCGKVILCAGNHPMLIARECYDRKTLALPPHQHELVMNLPSEKLILTIVSSYPYSIVKEKDISSAVLYTSHCGAELGTAVYDVVTGRYNPAARCPQTWYAYDADLPDIKNYNIIDAQSTYMYFNGTPLFPFGHGLSYSEFEYSDFKAIVGNDKISVSLNVKNISDTDGDEVVQIYFKENSGRKNLPNIKLCGFERINIKAGCMQTIEMDIPFERISMYNSCTRQLEVFEGEYSIYAAASSKDIRCKENVFIKGNAELIRRKNEYIYCTAYESCSGGSADFSITENDRYLKFGDWGGSITFDHCELDGCTHMKIYASAPCTPAAIELRTSDNNIIGDCDISPSSCQDDFAEIIIPISTDKPQDDITFNIKGTACIYKFCIY